VSVDRSSGYQFIGEGYPNRDSRLKAIRGREFCRLLEENNWELKRVTGSHHIFAKPGNKVRISVPVHGNKPMKIG